MRALALAVLVAAVPAAAERPRDWSRFWKAARAELAASPAAFSIDAAAPAALGEPACAKVSWAGLGGARFHGWYCRPAGTGPFPAVLISPWYSQGTVDPPRTLAARGVAALSWQARGYEVDQPSYPVANSWYVLDGIESPDAYVYRGIVAAGLRGLDVLASRPEVDHKRVGVMGASQGGGLSLLLASLDKRVALVAADFPFLSDWPASLASATQGPFVAVRDWLAANPGKSAAALATLSYFDVLNAAPSERAPALVQAGLRDRTCPPDGIRKAYAALGASDKRLVELAADHGERNAERWKALEDFVVARLVHSP